MISVHTELTWGEIVMPREAGYLARKYPCLSRKKTNLARKSHNDHAEPQRDRGRRDSVEACSGVISVQVLVISSGHFT